MARSHPWACVAACILTVITATILLVVASIFTNHTSYLHRFWGLIFTLSICTLVIASLAIIFAIGLLYVAFRRFPALTTLFSGLLVLNAVFSLAIIIILCIARPSLRDMSMDKTRLLLADYTNVDRGRNTKSLIDQVQQTYECCGADQATDWASKFPDGKSTPDSCCRKIAPGCGNYTLVEQNTIYLRGCGEPLYIHYRYRYGTLIGMHVTLIIFTIASAALGLTYERYIREQYQLM